MELRQPALVSKRVGGQENGVEKAEVLDLAGSGSCASVGAQDDVGVPAVGREPAAEHRAADDPTIEASLVRAARAGSRLAFHALYERLAGPALRLATRVARRRDIAEEACQEAFCQAWARLGSFRGDARFRTWLFAIVRNATLDLLRRERTRGRHFAREPIDEAPFRGEGPEATLRYRELLDDVAGALRELPEQTRSAFWLAAIERLGYEEIASVLETSVDSVKCRVYRARVHLRQKLAAHREGLR